MKGYKYLKSRLERPGSEGKAKSNKIKLHQWKSSVNVTHTHPSPPSLHSFHRYDLSIHHVWEQSQILQPEAELLSALQNLWLSFLPGYLQPVNGEVKHRSPHTLRGNKTAGFCLLRGSDELRLSWQCYSGAADHWWRLGKLILFSWYSLQWQHWFLWFVSPFRRHLSELFSVMPRVCTIIKKERNWKSLHLWLVDHLLSL